MSASDAVPLPADSVTEPSGARAPSRTWGDRLAPLAQSTEGSVDWIAEGGVPELRPVEPDRRKSGRGTETG